jgi:hypothetical protein
MAVKLIAAEFNDIALDINFLPTIFGITTCLAGIMNAKTAP